MTKQAQENLLYPGLPNYVGPKSGYFTLLHHEGPLMEWSHNVMDRIDFIKREKSSIEVPIRLRHIVHYAIELTPGSVQKAYTERQKAYTERLKAEAEWQKAEAEWLKADAEWLKADAERLKADAEWLKADAEWLKAEADKLLVYFRKHVPDHRWDGKEIVFT